MKTIAETIEWLQRLGRPPLPECPIEAKKQGKEPKAPCYFDGQQVISVNWAGWQTAQPSEEITDIWFSQPETGIGTLGGWNGQHWIGWIDFDQKNFASGEECDRLVNEWLEAYQLNEAPCFRTPSGGYRFLIAFGQEPKNFKANSKFSLSPNGLHAGELLCKNGSHTLLPPTVGINGQYEWIKFSEYPPVINSPEDIGIYRAEKSVSDSGDRQKKHKQKSDEPTAILPAAIVQPASRAARLWVVVRSLDNPANDGTGSGLVHISIADLCHWLQRSERSVWRYLKEALAKGYLYSCHCEYGQLRIEYRGLRSLAKHLGLQSLGAIGEFKLSEIQHAKARAADIAAEKLQAQSDHKRKEEWGRFAKGSRTAHELLHRASPSARVSGGEVICRGHRLLYLEPNWRPFGASQEGIAKQLGVSLRTVQYRLSNNWRRHHDIPVIVKAQSAHQILPECPKDVLLAFVRVADEKERYVFLGKRLFRVGCNLYDTGVLMKPQSRRKSEYRQALEACYKLEIAPGVLHGDYMCCDPDFKNFSEPETSGKTGVCETRLYPQ